MCMAGVLAATLARLRYPSPSTCRAAGRHTDNLPDVILGGDTPWARGFAPFAHAKGLCARMRFSAQAMVAVSVRRRPARILTVIVGNPGLRRSIDRLSSSRGRLKEDAMRSIVLGAIVAALHPQRVAGADTPTWQRTGANGPRPRSKAGEGRALSTCSCS